MILDGEDLHCSYDLMLMKELQSFSIKASPIWSLCDSYGRIEESTWWRYRSLRSTRRSPT